MDNQEQVIETTYLLAWSGESDGLQRAFFQPSTAHHFRQAEKISAGIQRGEYRVIVYCDCVHGDDYLTKDELRLVAACYLDGSFNTIEIDLRY